ncbi:molybdenum cofactor guanylyltransferase [Fluviibacter phosphoraccumulans]|jgi:molybdopterin-guanine dinucleotide biosynthesis protein A
MAIANGFKGTPYARMVLYLMMTNLPTPAAATNIIGIVLAGGRSSRMGIDKATLRIEGETLLLRMKRVLSAAGCTQVMLSGHGRDDWHENAIPDQLSNTGPVGGIISALSWAEKHSAPNTPIVFVPIDAPLLSVDLIVSMHRFEAAGNGCFISGSPLPLLLRTTDAVLQQSAKACADLQTKESSWSVRRFIEPLMLSTIDVNDRIKPQLTNVNTPTQWECLLRELENRS